jgi:hypothetical protein
MQMDYYKKFDQYETTFWYSFGMFLSEKNPNLYQGNEIKFE